MKHMKKRPPRFSPFAGYWRAALDRQRDRLIKKTLEVIELKRENEELWDIIYKQRIALEALRKGHAQDMAEMTESLRKTHEILSAAETDRDRYREALRRAFPKEAAAG